LGADIGPPLGFAGGLEFLAAAGGVDALGAVPGSVGGGASESGGAGGVWALTLPGSEIPADRTARANSALFIGVLQTALAEQSRA
jgi:hypothetical protein